MKTCKNGHTFSFGGCEECWKIEAGKAVCPHCSRKRYEGQIEGKAGDAGEGHYSNCPWGPA